MKVHSLFVLLLFFIISYSNTSEKRLWIRPNKDKIHLLYWWSYIEVTKKSNLIFIENPNRANNVKINF